MTIQIPEFALVAMVGVSSAGKSAFAQKHFLSTEILSSDFFRGMVCDDEEDQTVSKQAFDLLYDAADKRLENRKTTVIDATNLKKEARKKILATAVKHNVHTAAIVLDLPLKTALQRNEGRTDRHCPDNVIKRQHADLKRSIRQLKREGFRFVYILSSEDEINSVSIERTKLWNNQKEEHGPFDIIGDIHGCGRELVCLLEQLGYSKNNGIYMHPNGRKAVFLGDLCDRGNQNAEVLRIVMSMVKSGNAYAVPGNHDVKLLKYLNGKNVQHTHGLDKTIAELEKESDKFREEVRRFIDGLVSHYAFDSGSLVVAHAGIKEEYIGRGSGRIRTFCLYGDITGEKDEYDLPVRLNWAADYRGKSTIVYGHTPQKEVAVLNNTYCIDTGCVYGNKLTAMRFPEKEFVSVEAFEKYEEAPRPLGRNDSDDKDMLRISDVQGKMFLQTKWMPSVVVREDHSAAALEVMSRFSADPHWLIYLPPTMSPCATSSLDDYLEYPIEAFDYYRKNGVRKVICEKKHMGSRAVIILCRTAETAQKRFGVFDGSRGMIYTRTGRQFFGNGTYETDLLDRLESVLTESGFWEDFQTDWVCLDTELMPWSEKAKDLLKKQYAPVGRAGKNSLGNAVKMLEQCCMHENRTFDVSDITSGQNISPEVLLKRYREKQNAIDSYIRAYREYCSKVESVDDFRIAPFHLLAVEGRVFDDITNRQHMEILKQYCTGTDDIWIATDYTEVDLYDEESIRKATDWWLNLTENGGEGMVVKPEYFAVRHNAGIIQPAVKCRGAEYLRIIYGPEYRSPEHIRRLKKRSLSKKRSLALREFALGMESLKRFVEKEPLYKVHECVFGVLAFESEPVDPRL